MQCLYSEVDFAESKSADKLPLKCECCGKTFYTEKRQIKFELAHKRGRLRFCSPECFYSQQKQEYHTKCAECGQELYVKKCAYDRSHTKKFFCSSSCAAKYNNKKRGSHSEKTKQKIKEGVLEYCRKQRALYSQKSLGEEYEGIKPRSYKLYTCKVCGKEYSRHKGDDTSRKCCSKECSKYLREHRKEFLSEDAIKKLSQAGRHSAKVQSECRRSKNEMYFYELCKKHFKNVLHNQPIFNGWDADVIIEDKKYAILWNGKWHYKQITRNHSVQQVQNRDKIKINEIIKSGYTPYIITDMGKYNPLFVEQEFKKMIDIIH